MNIIIYVKYKSGTYDELEFQSGYLASKMMDMLQVNPEVESYSKWTRWDTEAEKPITQADLDKWIPE